MTEENMDFPEALREAQEQGYAEADPSADVDGFDSRSKLAILAAYAGWRFLPSSLRNRFKTGTEVFLLVPVVLAGAWAAFALGGLVEATLLGGSYRGWLLSALGLTYDQRNSLVVGVAMGFAVIPIIFTIAEDSLANVPQHLRAGSLALGATRWQTALRIVLPTASPGIFSAIMIGFGRAVGETMIVLMATGNTAVMDTGPFSGMRTLTPSSATGAKRCNCAITSEPSPPVAPVMTISRWSCCMFHPFRRVVGRGQMARAGRATIAFPANESSEPG
jgi:ABC-type molybdate transport system permease subunit